MGQSGGVCRTDRRRHSCRWEGDQTKKNRRPDRPKRVREGTSGGGGGGACIGEEKKRQILGIERWQTGGTGAGQGALSDSAPNWSGTALQYPTNAKKLKPKKRNSQTEGKKKWFGEGLGREIQKKNDGQTGGGVFVANHVPLFPLFPAHPLPFDKNNVLPWIFSLGANSKMGTIAGTRVLCTQYPARVTSRAVL